MKINRSTKKEKIRQNKAIKIEFVRLIFILILSIIEKEKNNERNLKNENSKYNCRRIAN